jgi:hypothetical protein
MVLKGEERPTTRFLAFSVTRVAMARALIGFLLDFGVIVQVVLVAWWSLHDLLL